jgi:hypothetical protein
MSGFLSLSFLHVAGENDAPFKLIRRAGKIVAEIVRFCLCPKRSMGLNYGNVSASESRKVA